MSSLFPRIFSTGLAMFSMFFGAGNVVFPLVIGQMAGDQTPFAILGLLITAVGVPFLGLIAILLFQGNDQDFFAQLGKFPGFLVTAIIMLLIGPFGGLPRCVALSYSTLQLSWPLLSFGMFSFLSCFLIFFCSYRKHYMLNLLGYILTPFLLFTLGLTIIMGLWTAEHSAPSSLSSMQSFVYGFMEGYNTMDLLASFFFSAIIYNTLKQDTNISNVQEERALFTLSLKASCVGGGLLALIYIGFGTVAAWHSASLAVNNQGEILGALTLKILGPYAGIVASATIALACLTTAIALAAVFAEFLQKILCCNKISYIQALTLTMIASFLISLLEFTGIVSLLAPLLQIVYPFLVMFTIFSIISRLKIMKMTNLATNKS